LFGRHEGYPDGYEEGGILVYGSIPAKLRRLTAPASAKVLPAIFGLCQTFLADLSVNGLDGSHDHF
jgi:hypothetical protein